MSGNRGPRPTARRRAARLPQKLAGTPTCWACPAGPPDCPGVPVLRRSPWLTWPGYPPRPAPTCASGRRGRPADCRRGPLQRAVPAAPGWPWLPCSTWQYSSALEVARLFHLRIGAPPMTARNAYVRGQGSMAGTLPGVVPIAAGLGPEYDVSELVTYLDDLVFCAPSTLLRLPVSWHEAGDRCFDLTSGTTGTRSRRGCSPTPGAPGT